MKEPFEITFNSMSILGIVHYDDEVQMRQNLTCVIACYGFNGNRVDQHRILLKFSEFAIRFGIITVRFDYRNHGLSDGTFMNAKFAEKSDDVIQVIKWLKNRFINKNINICLLGFSDGAKVTMDVYRKSKESIDEIILWNPVLSLSKLENTKRNHTKMFEVDKMILHPETRTPVIRFLGLWVNPSLMRDIQNDNYLSEVASCCLPLGIIWGENDNKTCTLKQMVSHKINNHNIMQATIPDADHLFSNSDWENQVFKETIKLIRSK